MKKLLICLLLPLAGLADTITGDIRDITGSNSLSTAVRFTPLSFPAIGGTSPTNYVVAGPARTIVPKAGIFTNELAGGAYKVSIGDLSFYISVPGTGGVHRLPDLATNGLTSWGYTNPFTWWGDGRYVAVSNGAATNLSLRGTPTLNGTNLTDLLATGSGSTFSNLTESASAVTVSVPLKLRSSENYPTNDPSIYVFDAIGTTNLVLTSPHSLVLVADSDGDAQSSSSVVFGLSANDATTLFEAGQSGATLHSNLSIGGTYFGSGSGLTNIGTNSMSAEAHAAYLGGGSSQWATNTATRSVNMGGFSVTNAASIEAGSVTVTGAVTAGSFVGGAATVSNLTFVGSGSSLILTNQAGTNIYLWNANRDRIFRIQMGSDSASGNGAEIYWNPWHTMSGPRASGEWQVTSSGSISLNPGYNTVNDTSFNVDRRIHLGSSGNYRDWIDVQYDHAATGSDIFGYSKPFRWITRTWNGSAESVKAPTIQGVAIGTNAWALRFFTDHTTTLVNTNQWDWVTIYSYWIGDVDNLGWNLRGRQMRQRLDVTPSATTLIDFNKATVQFITCNSSAMTLAGTNFPAGTTNSVRVTVYLDSSKVEPTLTFPAWNWFGAEPGATLTNGTMLRLELDAIGNNESNVMASASYGTSSFVYDADASDYFTRAGITEATNKAAVNALVVGLKADGIWDKCDAIYPFIGTSSNSHAMNLKTNAYPIAFPASGVVYANNGWQNTNATTGQISTGFNPTTAGGQFAQDSAHLFVYLGNAADVSSCYWIGAVDSVRAYLFPNGSSMAMYGPNNNTGLTSISASTDWRGPILGSRTSSNVAWIRNRIGNSGNETNATTALPNTAINIGTRGSSINQTLSTNRFLGASFGSGLSSSDWINMSNRWGIFQTSLGRFP